MLRLLARHVPLVCLALLFSAMSAGPVNAQGDLLVAPTRVVINGAGNAEVVLSNIGESPATYRISLELRRMDESGEFHDIAEADASDAERLALQMVRYAPRRITLMPGQPQAVRLSMRPPEGLPEGEYRVHMGFRAVPNSDAANAPEPDGGAAQGVSIKLTPIYGITIPIFLRKGILEAGAQIAGATSVKLGGRDFLQVTLSRTGKRSVYGELTGRTLRGEQVFVLRGIAVYPEVASRQVHVPLSAEQLAKLKGALKLEYRELPENGGALIAQATVNMP